MLGASWRRRLAASGAAKVCADIVASIGPTAEDPAAWRTGRPCDQVVGAAPIGHRVDGSRAPTGSWSGTQPGFVDPFTGEGIHRALVSAELASEAVVRRLAGDRAASSAYERAMREHFLAKDRVSRLVQAFLDRPRLFEYAARRLAARGHVRDTVGLVMGDLLPAERALDPGSSPRSWPRDAPGPRRPAPRGSLMRSTTAIESALRPSSSSVSPATSGAGRRCSPTTSASA